MNEARLVTFAGYGAPRARKRLYVGALAAMVAWLVLCNLALAAFSAHGLARILGQPFYNGWIAGKGMAPCLVLAVVTVGIDVLLLAASALLRTLRSDRPLSRRLAAPVLCATIIGLPAAWMHTRIDPLGDHALAVVFGEDTVYAPGYSADAFADIVPGTPWDSVMESLGAPWDAYQGAGEYRVRY